MTALAVESDTRESEAYQGKGGGLRNGIEVRRWLVVEAQHTFAKAARERLHVHTKAQFVLAGRTQCQVCQQIGEGVTGVQGADEFQGLA